METDQLPPLGSQQVPEKDRERLEGFILCPSEPPAFITVFRAIKMPPGFSGMKEQPATHSSGAFMNDASVLGTWAGLSTVCFNLTFRSEASHALI